MTKSKATTVSFVSTLSSILPHIHISKLYVTYSEYIIIEPKLSKKLHLLAKLDMSCYL